MIINSAKVSEQVQTLLNEAQVQAEELQAQQEELRVSNESLEEKAKKLLGV